MAKLNTHYQKLQAGYLFSEISKRTNAFIEQNPGMEILKLGIGNTTEPLPPTVVKGLQRGVEKLADPSTYTGYGDEQGDSRLRTALSEWYQRQGINLMPQEVFISDGAKTDAAAVQSIFSEDAVVAVQDPVYPVYVDSNVIAGRTGTYQGGQYEGLVYMPCTEENGFFPDLPREHVDLIYICSPNNPTGAVATHQELQQFVDYAREHQAIIIFDSAYSCFIQDNSLPRSIYEIEGAKECAIEISSFSKSAGFTGVRLGWTVVPNALLTPHMAEGEVNKVWNRRQTTMFNGASNIAQEGGLAVLSTDGQKECNTLVSYYMENAKLIKQALLAKNLTVFGGENAPYLWVRTLHGLTSWEFFDKFLNEARVVSTPGSGFGPHGEGYLRLSAFGHREQIIKAVESIERNLRI